MGLLGGEGVDIRAYNLCFPIILGNRDGSILIALDDVLRTEGVSHVEASRLKLPFNLVCIQAAVVLVHHTG